MSTSTRVVLPLKRPAVFRLVLWSALYGMFGGIILAVTVTALTGASAEMSVILRLAGPAGVLVAGVLARIRAPAMGIIVDDDGVELHGFWHTRGMAWTEIETIGWMKPGRRLAVRTRDGDVRAGAGKLPRRIPPDLVRYASAHAVDVVTARPLSRLG